MYVVSLHLKQDIPYNRVNLNVQNNIINNTTMPFLDTILHLGFEHLDITNTTVLIVELPETTIQMKSRDGVSYEINAYVEYVHGDCIIYIRPTNKFHAIMIMSHELIHILQYDVGQLSNTDTHVIYNYKRYPLSDLPPYADMPWERDAYSLSPLLTMILREKLINIHRYE